MARRRRRQSREMGLGEINLRESKGIYNRVPEDRIPPEAARIATNVDIGQSGQIRMPRPGQTKLLDGDVHSVWHWQGAGQLLYRLEDKLLRIPVDTLRAHIAAIESGEPSTLTGIELQSGVPIGLRYRYAEAGRRCYIAHDKGCLSILSADMIVDPLAPSTMLGVATLSPTHGLLADDARYEVWLVPVDRNRREGGVMAHSEIYLSTGSGGIRIDAPMASGADVIGFNAYISDPNDDETYFLSFVEPHGTILHTDPNSLGRSIWSSLLDVPPRGDLIAFAWGRIMIADGSTLWISEMNVPLFDLKRRGFVLSDQITMLAPVANGLWIATSREGWFLPGRDPSRWSAEKATFGGAVIGTAIVKDGYKLGLEASGPVAQWLSEDGVMAGLGDGSLINRTQDRYSTPRGAQGAAMHRYRNGFSQYVCTMPTNRGGKLRMGDHVSMRKIQ